MSEKKSMNQFDLKKALPWITLLFLIIIMFYLWPSSKSESGKPKKNISESTATVESSASVKNQTKVGHVQVVSPILNFRSKPVLNEKNIIATIKKGTTLKVVEKRDKWLKVQLDDGRIGFITGNKKYVKFIE
ncbi:MAG TPA: SH3 domain-containing protein [Actinobacteria bacterium]|nr:SH3 domain-containing protein [Actinomycetes bacterium]HEX21769.1 SH3 domain-containing protein [Actinomycetota bacterium]